MNKVISAITLFAASGAAWGSDDGLPPAELHRNMLMTVCIQDEVGALAAQANAMLVRSVYQFQQENLGPEEIVMKRVDGTVITLGWTEDSLTCFAEIPYGALGKEHFPTLIAGIQEAVTLRFGEIDAVSELAGGEQWMLDSHGGSHMRIDMVQAGHAVEIRSVTTAYAP